MESIASGEIETMELFAFAGLSNATILLTAAAVMGLAAVVSVVLRNLGLSSGSALANRVDRLEMRTASSGEYRSVISMASDILNGVGAHGAPHVVEMFEYASASNPRFARNINAGEAAFTLVNELKAGITIAAAIARPIQNMVDNGSIEVRAERVRLAGELRKQVAAIRTPTWDRHGAAILAAGVPSTTVSSIVGCFTQVQALKSDALALNRSSSVDAFAGILGQAAGVLASASQTVELFQGVVAEQPANEAEHVDDAGHDEAPTSDAVEGHASPAEAEAAHDDAAADGQDEHHDEHHDDKHGHDHAAAA